MRKLIPLLLGIVLVGAGIGAVQLISPGLDAGASPSGSVAGTTTGRTVEDRPETTTTVETVRRATTGVDISGPCDEAEHANDPRCAGTPQPKAPTPAPAARQGVDISGPCDEAEHANDPRCTGGAQANADDDRRGRGGDDDNDRDDRPGRRGGGDDNDDDHDNDDDRSGSNRGRG